MKKITLLTSLLLFTILAFPQARIIGGNNVEIIDYSYQVSIQNVDGHFCGGVIIDSNWVLTAAHCVQQKLHEDLLIYAGISSLSNKVLGQQKKVEKILVHSDFNLQTLENDLALLKIEGDFQITNQVKPIALLSLGYIGLGLLSAGNTAQVSGWGDTLNGSGNAYPDQLQAVSVSIIANEVANQPDFYDGRVTEKNLVAGEISGGKDACQGDSGGPLVVDKEGEKILAGIISWGDQCGAENKPGVYTKVSAFEDWIKHILYGPEAIFSLPEVHSINTSVAISNHTKGNALAYSWSADKGSLQYNSTETNFSFIPEESGLYTITLIARSPYGNDTLSKTLQVFDNLTCVTNPQLNPNSFAFDAPVNLLASSVNSLGVFRKFQLPDSAYYELKKVKIHVKNLDFTPESDSRLYIDVYDENHELINDLSDYITATSLQDSLTEFTYTFKHPIRVNGIYSIELWADEFYDYYEQIDFQIIESGNSLSGYIDPFAGNSYFSDEAYAYNVAIEPFGCYYFNEGTVLSENPIKDEKNFKASVYPNPASEFLYIESEKPGHLVLTTLQGKIVFTTNIKSGKNTINTNSLESGSYLYKLGEAGGLILKK